jgi:hypothetical protein
MQREWMSKNSISGIAIFNLSTLQIPIPKLRKNEEKCGMQMLLVPNEYGKIPNIARF